ncbi:MAG TPA: 6-phosphogluconolactonase, partial [Elusimicrobiota bacterium]|nr:6-phosphogluconolactonase [Elusimicrobiota bacterium]
VERAPAPPSRRVTLTLPLINRARRIFFMVTGKKKAGILADIFGGTRPRLPAQRVHPRSGGSAYWLDAAAARSFPSLPHGKMNR